MLTKPLSARRPSDEEIRRYLPLVHRVVRRMLRRLPPGAAREDLFAAGSRGLVDALMRDNGTDHAEFEHYAMIRIRGAILDELRANDWLSRGDRARKELSVVMLDDMAPGDRSRSTTDHDADAETQLIEEGDRAAVRTALESLPERERTIMQMRYFEGAQLSDIGARLAISHPRVSQLHNRAIARLRSVLGA